MIVHAMYTIQSKNGKHHYNINIAQIISKDTNKSLDAFLFRKSSLDWPLWFKTINGIARGLGCTAEVAVEITITNHLNIFSALFIAFLEKMANTCEDSFFGHVLNTIEKILSIITHKTWYIKTQDMYEANHHESDKENHHEFLDQFLNLDSDVVTMLEGDFWKQYWDHE
ncbi:hypothetical protein ACJX0J_033403, partial [Zea mays]